MTHEEIEVDLRTAEGIQKQLFHGYSAPSYLRIATRYLPYTHVSGDIFRLYPAGDDSFNLFLGDSTGHGVTAALTTVMAHILLSQVEEARPSDVLDHMNEQLLKHLQDGRFITAAHLCICRDGGAKAAIAAHPPVIIIPADGSGLVRVSTDSTILGVFPKPIFEIDEVAYQLSPGDKGLLYTDGITERLDSDGVMFELEGLCEFLRAHRSRDVEGLLSDLVDHMEVFAGGTKNDDDVTLIAFEYAPSATH